MTGTDDNLARQAHWLSSVLLRRWLAETHIPVAPGQLQLTVGPVRLSTQLVHHSPTGAHGFGSIHAVDSSDVPVVLADPVLLAAACSAEARARALPNAPINSSRAGSPVDWILHSLDSLRTGPLDRASDLAVEAESLPACPEAERWWKSHVEDELLPAMLGVEPECESAEQATVSLLTRWSLPAVGVLGRRGVADETELLLVLRRRLEEVASEQPEAAWLARHWLASPTLTDLAVLNGSDVLYRSESGAIEPQPVQFEVPNPLYSGVSGVPGVPVPHLGGEWAIRPVELGSGEHADVDLVHRWMNTEHVAVNWQQAWSWQRWYQELDKQLSGVHSLPCLVSSGGRQVAYLEIYRVLRDTLGGCYPHDPHDLGVHIAIGEPDAIGRGFGSALLRSVSLGLLAADPACSRIVAEPSIHNGASVRAFAKAGYVREREVTLPDKNSALMVLHR